jgi:hypothetical protein
VFPLTEVSAEIELPSDPESMSWADMQRFAARLSLEEPHETDEIRTTRRSDTSERRQPRSR